MWLHRSFYYSGDYNSLNTSSVEEFSIDVFSNEPVTDIHVGHSDAPLCHAHRYYLASKSHGHRQLTVLMGLDIDRVGDITMTTGEEGVTVDLSDIGGGSILLAYLATVPDASDFVI